MEQRTVREMVRLQSFDNSFVFQGSYKSGRLKTGRLTINEIVTNAIAPLLAKAIGTKISENL